MVIIAKPCTSSVVAIELLHSHNSPHCDTQTRAPACHYRGRVRCSATVMSPQVASYRH